MACNHGAGWLAGWLACGLNNGKNKNCLQHTFEEESTFKDGFYIWSQYSDLLNFSVL